MKTNTKKLHDWILPILFLVGIICFSLTTGYLYISNQKSYLTEKSEQIASGIAQDLRLVILNRVAILQILSKHSLSEKSLAFEDTAEALIQAYPGLFSINRVNSSGKIIKVVPFEPNRAALNQNLLTRDDVRDYLLEARETSAPTMSHKIMTYQKVPAFTLYLPLYSGSTFKGWLNAVVDFDSWTKGFIHSRELENIRIIIQWDHLDSGVIDSGAPDAPPNFEFKHKILNQELKISIGFSKDYSDMIKQRYDFMLAAVGTTLLTLALILIIMINISKLKLRRLNDNLALKNGLLSSLSHDLATPLTSLTIYLERLCRDKKEDLKSAKPQIHNVARLLSVMADMLKGARLLHAQDIGVMQIPTEPVTLLTAVQDATTLVAALADDKNIGFNILPSVNDKRILANAGTLVNNVLLNVLTNAIKFSPTNSTIKIYAEQKENEIFLFIEDQGAGLNLAQIENYKNLKFISSTSGTNNEPGTGLGLMQIHGFMKAYDGRIDLGNILPTGSCMTLIFKAA